MVPVARMAMARAAMKIVESGRVTDETRASSNEMHRCACCRSRGQVRRGNLLVLKAQHYFGSSCCCAASAIVRALSISSIREVREAPCAGSERTWQRASDDDDRTKWAREASGLLPRTFMWAEWVRLRSGVRSVGFSYFGSWVRVLQGNVKVPSS